MPVIPNMIENRNNRVIAFLISNPLVDQPFLYCRVDTPDGVRLRRWPVVPINHPTLECSERFRVKSNNQGKR